MTTARTVALDVLLAIRKKEAFVQELLDDALRRAELTPADRRLARRACRAVPHPWCRSSVGIHQHPARVL